MLDARIAALSMALWISAMPGATLAFDNPAEAAPTSEPEPRPGLQVIVDGQAAQLDVHQVRRAIEKELGVPVYGDANPATVGTLRVSATGTDDLVMVYEGDDGRRHERTVTLPREPDKRLETVALVAGNLARDETGALIEALRPPARPEPEAPPAPAVQTNEARARPSTLRAVAASPPADSATPEAPRLGREALNLALFHPLSLYSNSHELQFLLDLGVVYSHVGRVRGGALSWFVSRIDHGFSGVQVAGVATFNQGRAQGLALAGVFAQQLGDLTGALIGGTVTHATGRLMGLGLSGAAGWQRGPTHGAQVAGVLAHSHDVSGAQIAGAVASAGEISGVQISGAVNLADSVDGVMLAGASNLASGSARGVQLATVNVSESMQGLQLGIVNVAGSVDGMQLGVVNVADELDGVSLGVIPIAGNGHQHVVLWTSPGHAIANLGAKFRVGSVYSLLALGFQGAEQEGDSHTGSRILPGAALGMHLDIERAFVEVDAMFQSEHVADDLGEQRQLVALRPQLGVALVPWFAVFGGLAAETSFLDGNWNEDAHFRGFGGVQLF